MPKIGASALPKVSSSHIKRLAYWIKEREKIRIRKESGVPKPWTFDPILMTYRFCNVRRMDDKVSRWLLDNWYRKNPSHANGLVACSVARFFNKIETLELVTDLVYEEKIDWKKLKGRLRKQWNTGKPIFTGAYMVRGLRGVDKLDSVIDNVRNMCEINEAWNESPPGSLQEGWSQLIPIYGVGPFMSAQIMFDLRWHWEHLDWCDKMTWAAIGPGSRRGMNRILGKTGKEIHSAIPNEKFLDTLGKIRTSLIPYVEQGEISEALFETLEMIDFQNCLCEYDKYCRILFDEGRMKQLYAGRGE